MNDPVHAPAPAPATPGSPAVLAASRQDALQAELADPNTSPERLAAIAYAHPELGPAVTAHPNCYEGLRDWIAQYYGSAAAGLPAAAETAEAPDPSPRKQRRGPRRRLLAIAIAAAVAPVITVAAIVIPFAASMGETESSADTVDVLQERDPAQAAEFDTIGEIDRPDRVGNIDWLVPVSAPIESFPRDAAPGANGMTESCSDAEIAWLEQHATRGMPTASRAFSLTLHNSSTTGSSMPIGNIRFEGAEVPAEAFVAFQCPAGGRGDNGMGQPLLIGVDGREALYGEAVGVFGDDVMPEGSPVTVNLAPGEATALTLTRDDSVDRQRQYEGRFVADLMDGSGETVSLADDVTFRRDAVEYVYVGYYPGNLSDEFVCASPEFSTSTTSWGAPAYAPCTLAEAADVLREAARAAEG